MILRMGRDVMIDKESLDTIRKLVESNVGQKVKLKANRGRKRSYVKEGIICDTYRNLFTVRVDTGAKTVQTLSYTYSDVLTSNVELVLCSSNQKICTS
jgi:uncharacterized protein Veg